MKVNLKFTLLVVGISLTFFVMAREIIETRTRLKKSQGEIAQGQKEKAQLQQELKNAKSCLTKTERDLRSAKNKLGFVNTKLIVLKSNNTTLRTAKDILEMKVALLQEEKKLIEARLHSLKELKKAMRQVKIEISQDRMQRQEEIDRWKTARGNRGFLTKDGVQYYRPKVNVEVRPANISLNKK